MNDSSLAATDHHVRITQDGFGRATVELDGVSVEKKIAAVDINMRAGKETEIVLVVSSRYLADFEGLAHVVVGTYEEPDPGPAAAIFLSAIDAESLESAALSRDDLGTGPHDLTRAMLRQLQDWANGRA